MIPPFTGCCNDIMSLAPYLRGSLYYLRRAVVTAEYSQLSIGADLSPDGKLSFTVGNIPQILPTTEFKFPENDGKTDEIIDKVLYLLSAVKEK